MKFKVCFSVCIFLAISDYVKARVTSDSRNSPLFFDIVPKKSGLQLTAGQETDEHEFFSSSTDESSSKKMKKSAAIKMSDTTQHIASTGVNAVSSSSTSSTSAAFIKPIVSKSSLDFSKPSFTYEPGKKVVQFYSKSKNVDDLDNLPPHLNGKNWRHILSNFNPVQVKVNGHTYPTPEHAFHAAKCKCSNKPETFIHFTNADTSKKRVAKDPKAAKLAGGRKGFEKLGGKDLKLDVKKWNQERLKANFAILEARWEQDLDFRLVLSAIHEKIKKDNWYLLHFERQGVRAEWGGTYSESEGVKGRNLLGEQLMQLAREKLDSGSRSASKSGRIGSLGAGSASVGSGAVDRSEKARSEVKKRKREEID